jgi:hypothetical protein
MGEEVDRGQCWSKSISFEEDEVAAHGLLGILTVRCHL